MTSTTKVIIGLTVAATAGAAIGILLAPEKGTDLQRKIKSYAKDWMTGIMALLESQASSSPEDANSVQDSREISDAPEVFTTNPSKF